MANHLFKNENQFYNVSSFRPEKVFGEPYDNLVTLIYESVQEGI